MVDGCCSDGGRCGRSAVCMEVWEVGVAVVLCAWKCGRSAGMGCGRVIAMVCPASDIEDTPLHTTHYTTDHGARFKSVWCVWTSTIGHLYFISNTIS